MTRKRRPQIPSVEPTVADVRRAVDAYNPTRPDTPPHAAVVAGYVPDWVETVANIKTLKDSALAGAAARTVQRVIFGTLDRHTAGVFIGLILDEAKRRG